jgi:CheY-like chemotaxis protein
LFAARDGAAGSFAVDSPLTGMSKPIIAVVEDNADNRLLLSAILRDRYQIIEYENGPQALEGLARSLPDLVLLDISLPGMDGNEILSEIRRDGRMRHLPIIALTAHAMAGDRERFLDAGFNDYITKPIVDESLLLNAIDRWLSGG